MHYLLPLPSFFHDARRVNFGYDLGTRSHLCFSIICTVYYVECVDQMLYVNNFILILPLLSRLDIHAGEKMHRLAQTRVFRLHDGSD